MQEPRGVIPETGWT